jgi:NADH-quinone oxidoreductase subunit M
MVLTAAYVLWAAQRVFLGPLRERWLRVPDIAPREWVALAPLAALCIVLGVAPSLLTDLVGPSLAALLETIKAGAP